MPSCAALMTGIYGAMRPLMLRSTRGSFKTVPCIRECGLLNIAEHPHTNFGWEKESVADLAGHQPNHSRPTPDLLSTYLPTYSRPNSRPTPDLTPIYSRPTPDVFPTMVGSVQTPVEVTTLQAFAIFVERRGLELRANFRVARR
ncbi:hypothetical protein Bbelb_214380 [Branchiostoma belcheri]|nr:hypothetical protein Bbelb_214380 [Branchiostoma belcheri]